MVCKVAPKINRPACMPGEHRVKEAADYETALDEAGYGRFSHSVLGACSCAFFATGVQNCVMSYVLPAAKCELQLSTYQTGLVNMSFMSGGVASAFFWGIMGDVFGRRNILSATLLLDSIIMLSQSMVTDYRLLLAARTVNGFLIGGPSTLVFTYLSDLVGAKKRQFYLSITGMSFVAAWLILPAIAWLVIPFKTGHQTLMPLYSWRLYIALGSMPGFVSGLWMLFLPESPRLLLNTNRGDKAIKHLARMHRNNFGKSSEFKITKIIQHDVFGNNQTHNEESKTKMLFMGVLKDLKLFISKTYATKSSLILFVFFANMAAGFGLNLWIPELLIRMQGKECSTEPMRLSLSSLQVVNISDTWMDLVDVNNVTYGDVLDGTAESILKTGDGREICNDHMDDDVFTSGLIVGACCVVGNAACAAVCASGGGRGTRRAAVACAAVCAAAAACLAACACSCSDSNKVAVASAAALNAASLNGNVLLIRLLLHALPAKLRYVISSKDIFFLS
ncbi:hypothetical protein ACJJTC_016809 [Scirpophaga incertulas]